MPSTFQLIKKGSQRRSHPSQPASLGGLLFLSQGQDTQHVGGSGRAPHQNKHQTRKSSLSPGT